MKENLKTFMNRLEVIDAFIGFVGVIIILLGALVMQFLYKEEPCPLCLLQRAAFVGVGISFLLTLRYGNRTAHWASAILCACAGMAVSIRQICLHLTDPTGFGSAVFGLHMYTWCFIGFSVVIVGSAAVLLLYPEQAER